jgi:hypothetical protein
MAGMWNVNCVILLCVSSVITPVWNTKYVNVLIPFCIQFSVRLSEIVSVEGTIVWLSQLRQQLWLKNVVQKHTSGQLW